MQKFRNNEITYVCMYVSKAEKYECLSVCMSVSDMNASAKDM